MTGLFLHFLKLEVSIAKKYRVKLLFNLLHIVCLITLFYYISKTIGIIEVLDATYFPFVSTGLAFSYLTSGIINSSAGKITEWRDLGILEGLLLSPKSPWQLYLGAGLMDALLSTFKFIAILLFLSIGFLEIEAFRPGLLLFSTLTIIAISIGFSLIEACSILLWKRWGLLSSLSAINRSFSLWSLFSREDTAPIFSLGGHDEPFFPWPPPTEDFIGYRLSRQPAHQHQSIFDSSMLVELGVSYWRFLLLQNQRGLPAQNRQPPARLIFFFESILKPVIGVLRAIHPRIFDQKLDQEILYGKAAWII